MRTLSNNELNNVQGAGVLGAVAGYVAGMSLANGIATAASAKYLEGSTGFYNSLERLVEVMNIHKYVCVASGVAGAVVGAFVSPL